MLALGACALIGLSSSAALADRAEDQLPPGARVVKIGPQAVVMRHANGRVSMYDDPSQQARVCKSMLNCLGPALTALSLFGLATYEDITSGMDGAAATMSSPAQPAP